MDMPPGWTPQPNTSVDPQLKTDLSEIKEHPPTQQEYMPRIVEKLKECYDPEISIDIYNLGLIYDVFVNEDSDVKILMTLTTPNCPVAESLPMEVEEKVKSLDEVKTAEVEITFDPPWTQDLMSEEAKLELGML